MLSESLFLTLSDLNLARDMRRQLPKLVRKHRSVLPELSQPRWTEQPKVVINRFLQPTCEKSVEVMIVVKAKIWSWQPCGFCCSPKKNASFSSSQTYKSESKTNTTDKVVKPEPGGFTFHKNGHLLLPRHHRSVNVLKSRGFSPKAESCCHQAHGHHGHPLAWTAGNVGSNIGILCLMPLYLFTLFTASVSLDSCQNLCFALYVLVGCRPAIVLICISLAVLVPSWNICESL